MRPAVVGPGRDNRMGRESTRRRLPVRLGRRDAIQPDERHRPDMSGASARHGGLQVAFRRDRAHRLVGAQLLLPMRQRRCHPRARRVAQQTLYHFRRRAAGSTWRAC